MKIITKNKKAYFDYEILESFEAGLVLTGQEVKSIKTGHIGLKGAYVVIKDNEAYLINATVPPYQPKNAPEDYNPTQARKLLLKKSELKNLFGKARQKGLTMIPLKVYTKRGKIKLEFAIARGRKKVDKRELIKKREIDREMRSALKGKF